MQLGLGDGTQVLGLDQGHARNLHALDRRGQVRVQFGDTPSEVVAPLAEQVRTGSLGEQHQEGQGGGKLGNSLRGVEMISASHCRVAARPRVGEVVGGSLRVALVAIGVPSRDESRLL